MVPNSQSLEFPIARGKRELIGIKGFLQPDRGWFPTASAKGRAQI